MGALLAIVPWPYRALALIALAAALLGFGWMKGAEHVQAKWDAATTEQSLSVARIKQKQAEATVQVVTKYIDRVRVVQIAGDTIIKEVPKYVPSDSPALPAGFRLLHDAAAGGYPIPASGTDAAAVPAEVAAETIAANYTTCRENAEKLTALQEWVRAQEAAAN